MNGLKTRIERFRRQVETAARSDRPVVFFSLETALRVAAVLYKNVMIIRARLYANHWLPSKTLPCRVVSIGNIVAGGTGKTPMTIFVAQSLRNQGTRVVVISRGYRGRMEDRGGIVSDGHTLFAGPEDAGDEPYLMARILKDIPVIVGRRRHAAGKLAIERFNPDVIILDDAFQHLRLKRDLDLVLLDSRFPFGNGHVLPRGLLREPVSALGRADALVLTRCDITGPPPNPRGLPAGSPVFYAAHTPVIRKTDQGGGVFWDSVADISWLKGKKTVAFAGLADNNQFFKGLSRAGCLLEDTISFRDHHSYCPDDLARIAQRAKAKGAEALVTTPKDFVKIENGKPLPLPLMVVDVVIQMIRDKDSFFKTLFPT